MAAASFLHLPIMSNLKIHWWRDMQNWQNTNKSGRLEAHRHAIKTHNITHKNTPKMTQKTRVNDA